MCATAKRARSPAGRPAIAGAVAALAQIPRAAGWAPALALVARLSLRNMVARIEAIYEEVCIESPKRPPMNS